jgi:protein O-mannosyl-transferase
VPVGLSFEHLYDPLHRLADPWVLAATTLYVILCVGFMRGLKSSWQSASFGLFGVLWFFITLSPTSSVFPTTATMAENRVYLPSIGLYLVIVYLGNALIGQLTSGKSQRAALLVMFGAYAASLGYVAHRRNILYQLRIPVMSVRCSGGMSIAIP